MLTTFLPTGTKSLICTILVTHNTIKKTKCSTRRWKVASTRSSTIALETKLPWPMQKNSSRGRGQPALCCRRRIPSCGSWPWRTPLCSRSPLLMMLSICSKLQSAKLASLSLSLNSMRATLSFSRCSKCTKGWKGKVNDWWRLLTKSSLTFD